MVRLVSEVPAAEARTKNVTHSRIAEANFTRPIYLNRRLWKPKGASQRPPHSRSFENVKGSKTLPHAVIGHTSSRGHSAAPYDGLFPHPSPLPRGEGELCSPRRTVPDLSAFHC